MTVANSIDATLDAVNTDESMTIDRVLPDLEKSLGFQRLLNLHMTRFYTRTDVAIPERIRVAVMHSFWLGMECGRAAEASAKLEAMFQEV